MFETSIRIAFFLFLQSVLVHATNGPDNQSLSVHLNQIKQVNGAGDWQVVTRASITLLGEDASRFELVCAGELAVNGSRTNDLGTTILVGSFSGSLLLQDRVYSGNRRPFYVILNPHGDAVFHLPAGLAPGALRIGVRNGGFVLILDEANGASRAQVCLSLDHEGELEPAGPTVTAEEVPLPVYVEDDGDEEIVEDPLG